MTDNKSLRERYAEVIYRGVTAGWVYDSPVERSLAMWDPRPTADAVLAVRDDVLAEKDADTRRAIDHYVGALGIEKQRREAAEAENKPLREALAKVERLFAGGPDTPCRTTWHDGPFDTRIECVEVPVDDLRAALASVPAVDAGDHEPASEGGA